jgi:non-haem Fe2+, alpha-ketoglutarate-dependent halogenase
MGLLNEEQLARYAADGVLHPLPVLSPAEVDAAGLAFDQLRVAMGGRPRPLELTQLHVSFKWAWALAAHSRVLDVAESLIGPDIAIWATSVFCKYAEDDAYVGWHQDARYWGLSSNDVASVWIALTPSHVGNGAMRVLAGSHLGGLLAHAETVSGRNVLSRGQEIAELPPARAIIDVELAPGECSVHHVLAVHGSAPNTSASARIGFVIRYLPPHVRQAGGAMALMPARGDAGAFAAAHLQPPPLHDDMSDTGIRRFRQAASDFLQGVRRAADGNAAP